MTSAACRRRSPRSPRCSSARTSRCFPAAVGYVSSRACEEPLWIRRCSCAGRVDAGRMGRAAGSSRASHGSRSAIRSTASPLAGYAPVLGVYGVILATVAQRAGGVHGAFVCACKSAWRDRSRRVIPCICGLCSLLVALWLRGFGLMQVRLDRAARRAGLGQPASGQHPAGHQMATGEDCARRSITYRDLALREQRDA